MGYGDGPVEQLYTNQTHPYFRAPHLYVGVAARFMLDALPGKQMAVDTELNAGAIDEREASRRRGAIAREADFYGAMDGATKFVRGDAIAAVLITIVNIVGGFLIGTLRHGMPMSEALSTYTILTIGEGLVARLHMEVGFAEPGAELGVVGRGVGLRLQYDDGVVDELDADVVLPAAERGEGVVEALRAWAGEGGRGEEERAGGAGELDAESGRDSHAIVLGVKWRAARLRHQSAGKTTPAHSPKPTR